MRKEIKRLGDAELEIMQAIWAAGKPVNSAYIQAALAGKRDWALPATLTALSRLCDKGFLSSEKQGRSNFTGICITGSAEFSRSYGNAGAWQNPII